MRTDARMLETARGQARVASYTLKRGWLRLNREIPPLRRVGAFAWEVIRKYRRDDCLSYAASLSFFMTLSLIPLATLFFSIMALVMGSSAYSLRLQRAIAQMYPYLPDNFIREIIAHSKRIDEWSWAWVMLLIGAHWGLRALDRALSHIFDLRTQPHRQTRNRHYWLRRFAVVLAGLCFLVILLSAGFEWSLRRHAVFSPSLAITLLPALIGLALITLVLQHLPRRHVRFRHALLGASVTTVLWWGAKGLFGIYYTHAKASTWGVLYGSLGSLMAALIFLYYSSCIFLLGAEITAAFYQHGSAVNRAALNLRLRWRSPRRRGVPAEPPRP